MPQPSFNAASPAMERDMTHDPISVLLVERNRPDLLALTLDALWCALQRLRVDHETIVVVRGSARRYRQLEAAYPWVTWRYGSRLLNFRGVVRMLLNIAKHPWCYVMHADLQLHPEALASLQAPRSESVFALASHIRFAAPSSQHQETGYTYALVDAELNLWLRDAPVLADEAVRGTLYARCGSSMFQTELLRRYFQLSAPYKARQLADADWSTQAWSDGKIVLFCPASQVVRDASGTFDDRVRTPQLRKIIEQNLAHFRWRYADFFNAQRSQESAPTALQNLLRRLTPSHQRARQRALGCNIMPDLRHVAHSRFPHAGRFRPSCLRVLLVSPFSVLPPSHGAARRLLELARSTATTVDWVLLSDEHSVSAVGASADDDAFREIHLIGDRPQVHSPPLARLLAHAHEGMMHTMQHLIHTRAIDVVCLEHPESLGLVKNIPDAVPIVFTLHDAGRELSPEVADFVRAQLPRVSALVLTTDEDVDYWQHPKQTVIENGVRLPAVVSPSPAAGDCLIVATFRYEANVIGLKAFLASVWPQLYAAHPDRRLVVLAGDVSGAQQPTVDAIKDAPGLLLICRFVDPAPYYEACALAINPQSEVEGSSIKVIEALGHGRVMVTTTTGARGFDGITANALCRASTDAAMFASINHWLNHPEDRWAAERGARMAVESWRWEARGRVLAEVLAAASAS
jgi:Glycosyl transferases group 1